MALNAGPLAKFHNRRLPTWCWQVCTAFRSWVYPSASKKVRALIPDRLADVRWGSSSASELIRAPGCDRERGARGSYTIDLLDYSNQPSSLRAPEHYSRLVENEGSRARGFCTTRSAIAPATGSRFFTMYYGASNTASAIFPRARSIQSLPRLNDYAHNVRRDIHKMHAFLRFRACTVDGAALYTAWFEPQHFILRRAAPFFVDRFAA